MKLQAMILTGALLAVTQASVAQPPFPLPKPPTDLPGKLAMAREAASTLAQYPPEVRQAILEVAQDPKLVVSLNKATDDSVVNAAPKELQPSARLLRKYPQVLRIMQQHLPLTTLVGTLYQQDKQGMLKLLDGLNTQQAKEQQQTTDNWAELLANNPEALAQLKEAAEAFAAYVKQQEASSDNNGNNSTDDSDDGSDDDSTEEYYDDYALAAAAADAGTRYAATEAVVDNVPSGQLANYALHHADQYGALANAVLQQYWRGNNPLSFNQGVDRWWRRFNGKVPANFFHQDGKLGQRLGDLAKVDNQLTQSLKGQKITPQQRGVQLDKALGSAPFMKELPKGEPPLTTKPPVPVKPPVDPSTMKITRGAPTQALNLQRAQANHAAAWQRMPAPNKTPRPNAPPRTGGPPRVGGPRPGPGPRP
ncbi:MAG: hypothetical protein AB7K24_09030 [Gemmataceae bacterium]